MKRNEFIKLGAISIPALFLPETTNAEKKFIILKSSTKNDENYWKMVREQFPLSKDRTYFNNGTMGPSPYPVIQAVYHKMLEINTSGKYGGYEDEVLIEISKFMGVEKTEIALTHNVTEGTNIVAWGLDLKKNDEIIITNHEHAGGALPWLSRSKIDGVKIKVISLGKSADETIEMIKKAITPKTKVLALPHIPCTIGQVLPIKAISKLAKEKGIFSFFDGAHGPGMLDIDLHDIDCDFYSSCCHKWMLGPKGTGFLYIKKSMLDVLNPKFMGAGSDNGYNILAPDPVVLKDYHLTAHRYFYGTQSAEFYTGIAAAIQFQNMIGKKTIESRIKELTNTLRAALANSSDFEILSPLEDISSGGITTFRNKKMDTVKMQEELAKKGFVTRHVHENKLHALRISTHIYNSIEEVSAFEKALYSL